MPARMPADAICTALQPRRAVTVVGETRDGGEPEPHRDVAGDHTAALERLGDDDVVDVAGRDPGALDHRADRDLRERERVDVDE